MADRRLIVSVLKAEIGDIKSALDYHARHVPSPEYQAAADARVAKLKGKRTYLEELIQILSE
jgi:hypothetical protein